jgi:hypothetical protein
MGSGAKSLAIQYIPLHQIPTNFLIFEKKINFLFYQCRFCNQQLIESEYANECVKRMSRIDINKEVAQWHRIVTKPSIKK